MKILCVPRIALDQGYTVIWNATTSPYKKTSMKQALKKIITYYTTKLAVF